VKPPPLPPIRLSIGEPQHATPELIRRALVDHLSTGLSSYPLTPGLDELRNALAGLVHAALRASAPRLRLRTCLPVNGTREALFALCAGRSSPPRAPSPLVVLTESRSTRSTKARRCWPGAEPVFLNQTADRAVSISISSSLTEDQWRRTQLMYVCSPGQSDRTRADARSPGARSSIAA
jgi:N-succinyldiaminopimelate aminotransferase